MERNMSRTGSLAATSAGAALAGTVRVLSALRPALKPLHPRGEVTAAVLRRTGEGPPTGVPWLDEPGRDEVLLRRSRAVGLPDGLPDIHGLALRVPCEAGGHGDLLMATTGTGRLGRFVLTAGRSPHARPMTTLLPYRTPAGPVTLAAVAVGDHAYELAYASVGGAWHRFADLVLRTPRAADALVSFDPVRNTVTGLENYAWVRRLREPAYRTSRRSRRG
jgi:hypothetical protein